MRLEPTGMELMLSKSGAPFPPHEDTRKSLQPERGPPPPPTQPHWCPHLRHPTSRTVRSRFCDLQFLLFVVQSLNRLQLFATLWTAEHQSSLSFTIFWSFLKFMSIESVMLSNHLILCHPFSSCLQYGWQCILLYHPQGLRQAPSALLKTHVYPVLGTV